MLLAHTTGIGFFLALALAMLAGNGLASAPLIAYTLGVQLFLFGLYLFAAWKISDSLGWRVYFLSQSLMLVLGFLLRFLIIRFIRYEALYLSFYMPLLFLLIAAIGDRVRGRVRDWPHWVGVVLPFAVFATSLTRFFHR